MWRSRVKAIVCMRIHRSQLVWPVAEECLPTMLKLQDGAVGSCMEHRKRRVWRAWPDTTRCLLMGME